jgi:hypothetical protein
VGQGLFFAGQNHVHVQIIASPTETGLITTNPEQVQAIEQQVDLTGQNNSNIIDLDSLQQEGPTEGQR